MEKWKNAEINMFFKLKGINLSTGKFMPFLVFDIFSNIA